MSFSNKIFANTLKKFQFFDEHILILLQVKKKSNFKGIKYFAKNSYLYFLYFAKFFNKIKEKNINFKLIFSKYN